jgi:hypothetical protein
MNLRLICALPNPGCSGAPRGLFYSENPEGQAQAEEFARQENRQGWGVFKSMCNFKDTADLGETFQWVLEQNGFPWAES